MQLYCTVREDTNGWTLSSSYMMRSWPPPTTATDTFCRGGGACVTWPVKKMILKRLQQPLLRVKLLHARTHKISKCSPSLSALIHWVGNPSMPAVHAWWGRHDYLHKRGGGNKKNVCTECCMVLELTVFKFVQMLLKISPGTLHEGNGIIITATQTESQGFLYCRLAGDLSSTWSK